MDHRKHSMSLGFQEWEKSQYDKYLLTYRGSNLELQESQRLLGHCTADFGINRYDKRDKEIIN